eukprot:SAG31_NODE_794_length_12043_cov_7.416192_7_plen_39_part_00
MVKIASYQNPLGAPLARAMWVVVAQQIRDDAPSAFLSL